MKKFTLLSTLLLCTFFLAAQNIEFKRSGDRKVQGATKKIQDVSLIQTSVLFQNITKRGIHVNERGLFGAAKSLGSSMSAELIAYLLFSDEEPGAEEYQDITNEFNDYLNKKLIEKGLHLIDWAEFENSDYYANLKENKEKDFQEDQDMVKKGNAWRIFTANNGPRVIKYNPASHKYTSFGVPGVQKLKKYAKGVNAKTLMALNVVVDFADIFLEGDAHSGRTERTYSTVDWKKSTVKYDLSPHVRVTSRENGGSQIYYFTASSGAYDEFYSVTDIRASQPLEATKSQDSDLSMNKNLLESFLGSLPSVAQKHSINPFVVETTKEAYLNSVREVLMQYADALADVISEK